jgi:hypothetical protein
MVVASCECGNETLGSIKNLDENLIPSKEELCYM